MLIFEAKLEDDWLKLCAFHWRAKPANKLLIIIITWGRWRAGKFTLRCSSLWRSQSLAVRKLFFNALFLLSNYCLQTHKKGIANTQNPVHDAFSIFIFYNFLQLFTTHARKLFSHKRREKVMKKENHFHMFFMSALWLHRRAEKQNGGNWKLHTSWSVNLKMIEMWIFLTANQV